MVFRLKQRLGKRFEEEVQFFKGWQKDKKGVARVGIVTWYYGVYGAASAMIAACDGSFPDNHAATAQQWDRQFPANGLARAPFGDRLSNLLESTLKCELAPIRARGKHSLTTVPATPEQAWGAAPSTYLAPRVGNSGIFKRG